MQYKPEQEKQLVVDLLSYAYDPLAFVMYAYPWGEVDTPLEHFSGPRRWQRKVLEDIRDHTQEMKFNLEADFPLSIFREAVRSGRGPGKSALFGWLSHWHISTHLGSSTIVTANTESQLRSKTFPEFARWFTMAINSHWWHVDSLKIYPRDWLSDLVSQQLKIDPHYWNIAGQNWSEENPDAFAGAHNSYGLMVLFDEASGIADPIWNVTNGFFTEENAFRYWLAFSNPRRNAGPFFNRFNKREFQATWRTRHIDCRHVEGIDQSVNEAIISEHGEHSDVARVEVYGEFPEASTDQFIPNSVVREAQKREIEVFDDSQPIVMGVDPAPRGRTVIRFRQGRDARSIPPTVLQGADNTGIVSEIIELINRYDPDAIAVDAGQGTGVIDSLKQKRVRVHEVWFGARADNPEGEFATLGSELWGKMRDWLPGGCIDESQELFRDLTARTWKWAGREDSKKILTSKRDMAADGIPSPDDGDALAATFYPKITQRHRRSVRGGIGSGVPVAAGMDDPVLG